MCQEVHLFYLQRLLHLQVTLALCCCNDSLTPLQAKHCMTEFKYSTLFFVEFEAVIPKFLMI